MLEYYTVNKIYNFRDPNDPGDFTGLPQRNGYKKSSMWQNFDSSGQKYFELGRFYLLLSYLLTVDYKI